MISAVRTNLPPGATSDLTLALNGLPTVTVHVVHGELQDPDGAVQPGSAVNLRLSDTSASWAVQVPANAKPGRWTAVVTDMLTGAVARQGLEVQAPQ